MKIVKILHVINSTNFASGGPVEGLSQLIKALSSSYSGAYTMECVTSDEPTSSWLGNLSFKVHPLGPSFMKYAYTPKLIPWLKKNIHKYDVVIVNGIWQYHSYAIWRVLKGVNKNYYIFTHGMLDPWFKSAYPFKHLKKYLYWFLFQYRILRDAKAVLFTCENERILARKSFSPYRCNEVTIRYGTSSAPTNLDEIRTSFLLNHPELQNKRIFLFLGRIHHKKACDLLISAFAQVADFDPNLQLVIAGPDEVGLVSLLKVQAVELNIENRITWIDFLTGNDKWGAYMSAEVFCLPSHQENFGIVVAEALSCSKPVLISNKVNIWNQIELFRAGIVENDTLEGTVKSLRQWLEMSSQEKNRMNEAALECFNTQFSVEAFAEDISNLIRSDLSDNSLSPKLQFGNTN